jgi:response regulator of citrate/malate metabolism
MYPKGIQEKTLRMILEHMQENPDQWLTGDEIAERTGLTSVTVRRYMNYLAEAGKVAGEMNYETGGRPCMRYKMI